MRLNIDFHTDGLPTTSGVISGGSSCEPYGCLTISDGVEGDVKIFMTPDNAVQFFRKHGIKFTDFRVDYFKLGQDDSIAGIDSKLDMPNDYYSGYSAEYQAEANDEKAG